MTQQSVLLVCKSILQVCKIARNLLVVGFQAPGMHYCSLGACASLQGSLLKPPLLHFSSLIKFFSFFFFFTCDIFST